jgi:dienelactone hydrolase
MDFNEIDQLRNSNRAHMQSFPDNVPMDMDVLYTRKLDGFYEEWKVMYSAEATDTARPRALQRVPAYLLIPLRSNCGPPYPAMIAFHQCFCDCDVGKDAVVGRFLYRPDQAYAVELARRGFVVLAPDTVCCGERLLPWVGKQGRLGDRITRECMMADQGNPAFEKEFGYNWRTKVMLDARRAVDLLQSLDFVDSDRVGAIGHSMGSEATLLSMLADERIKAGIVSGSMVPKVATIASLAPRLFMALQGRYDGAEEMAEQMQAVFDNASAYYEHAGTRDNLQLRTMPCGHYFLEEFKWRAFGALREHFAMPKREQVLIRRVLEVATERLSWIPRSREVVRIGGSEDVRVSVDVDDLAWAFYGILKVLVEKTPWGSHVDVEVRSNGTGWSVECFVAGGNDSHKQPHEYHLSRVPFILAECGARLNRRTTPDGLRYVVTTQNGASKSMQATPHRAHAE